MTRGDATGQHGEGDVTRQHGEGDATHDEGDMAKAMRWGQHVVKGDGATRDEGASRRACGFERERSANEEKKKKKKK